MTHLRKFSLIDENGNELVLTPDGYIPVSLFDSNNRELILTDQSNVPVALRDKNSLELEFEPTGDVPVIIKDKNGLELELELDKSVPVTSRNEYFVDISRGVVPATGSEFKFGRSELVTTTESVIWDNGGNYVFLEAAETMDIVSSSADDDLVGIGAQTLLVAGLDVNYNELSEIIELDGLNTVVTTGEFLRVFRAVVITSGTNDPINDANKGVITISGTTSTTTQAKIQINNGQTLMAVYTVPAGKTAHVTGISLSAGQGKQCLFKAKFRNGPSSTNAFSVKFTMDLYEAHFFGSLTVPLRVPEKTDIVITGQTSVGTIDAGASFGAILIND